MIIFKGKCKTICGVLSFPDDDMMTKASGPDEAFLLRIRHFSTHLENHGTTLFCVPSNTTHELQPADKTVFRSFKYFWHPEVLKFSTTQPGEALFEVGFGEPSIVTRIDENKI